MIYILIPTFERFDLTIKCIESIYKQTYNNFHIIVIDDQSKDLRYKSLKSFKSLTLLSTKGNKFWGGTMNVGLNFIKNILSDEDYLLMLNNDTFIPKDYLSKLFSLMELDKKIVIGSVTKNSLTNKIESTVPIRIGFAIMDLLKILSVSKFKKTKYFKADYLSGRGTIYPYNAVKKLKTIHFLTPHYFGDYCYSNKATNLGYELRIYPDIFLFNTATFSNQENHSKFFDKKSIDYLPAKTYFFLTTGSLRNRIFYIPWALLNKLIVFFSLIRSSIMQIFKKKFPKHYNFSRHLKNNWASGLWKNVILDYFAKIFKKKFPKHYNFLRHLKNNWASGLWKNVILDYFAKIFKKKFPKHYNYLRHLKNNWLSRK